VVTLVFIVALLKLKTDKCLHSIKTGSDGENLFYCLRPTKD